MTAVPSVGSFIATIQDAHGDVAVVRFPTQVGDISSSTGTIASLYTDATALFAALATCINGKVVKQGFEYSWSRAQKPNGPLSTYAHVYQALELNFGDGGLERTRISLPTPLTTDMLADGITANPSDANVSALIAAVEAHCSSKGGTTFNEYLGGRFREGKPRRRTNLYNAPA